MSFCPPKEQYHCEGVYTHELGLGVGVQSQMKMSSLLINIIKNYKLSNSTMTIMD